MCSSSHRIYIAENPCNLCLVLSQEGVTLNSQKHLTLHCQIIKSNSQGYLFYTFASSNALGGRRIWYLFSGFCVCTVDPVLILNVFQPKNWPSLFVFAQSKKTNSARANTYRISIYASFSISKFRSFKVIEYPHALR